MLKPIFFIGFSGNRSNGEAGRSPEELESTRDLIRAALVDFQARAEREGGEIEIVSSIAEGADTIACEVALALKLPIHIILPMPEEEFAGDFANFSTSAWQRAKAIIDVAREPSNHSTIRVVDGSHQRPKCYKEVNEHILEAVDAVVLVNASSGPEKEGGTREFERQIEAFELPHVHINPLGGRPVSAHLEQFANPENGDSGLKEIGEISKSIDGLPTSFDRLSDVLSKSAGKSSKWFLRSVTIAILFHGIAALIASWAASFAPALNPIDLTILSGAELALVSIAFILMFIHGKRHTQKRWLKCRFAREILRSSEATAGILDPLFPKIRLPISNWKRFFVSTMLLAARARAQKPSTISARDHYLDTRINSEIDYFSKEYNKARPRARAFRSVAQLTSTLAVIVVAIAFIYKIEHLKGSDHSPSTASHILYFTLIALPLIAGIANSLYFALDVGRRVNRYRKLEEFLRRRAKWIASVETEDVLERAIAGTEEVLLHEQFEWFTSVESGLNH